MENIEQKEKIYIEIAGDLVEIVEGVEYEVPLEQAIEMGFDEDSEGDDDGSER
ncbi:MAG: hypothetical protein WC279_09770 [Sulfurimonas sp.]|jgi:hypothetical protein|uniref:hypothetical protein n=1 Tax=Sulfurimonas sp. TaxID=2022749 RepID=UPI00356461AE